MFPELGDDVPGDVDVLPPVEMFLHRTELEPVKFLRLGRDVDLVENVVLASSPQDVLQDTQHGPGVPGSVGLEDSQPPPGLHQEGIQLEEEQEAVEVIERLAHRSSRDAPLVYTRQSQCHLGSLGSGRLDHLGLVQADPPPLDAGDR